MILVQNRQLQLSGNKFWQLIFICFCLSACSPKARTNKSVKKEPEAKESPVAKADQKLTEATVSLLVPFNANAQKTKSGNKAELEKSAMAIDFYQGFKMGIDSAAAKGLNFRLKVLDTKDNNAQLASLIAAGKLSSSNLIVGPVFPDGQKFISNYSIANHIPVISPLAASHPDEFTNPNLISIVNNIDLHAQKIADYIVAEFDPAKTVIVLINTRKSTDEMLAKPFRDYFQKGKGIKYAFQEYSSVYAMEAKTVPGKGYLVLLASSDRQFVIATLDKLVKMKGSGTQINLFGHPNWTKQNYSTEKLQLLNTKITSSYTVDYKNAAVIDFVKKYRKHNGFEPSEYSFKGFDIGYYFGKLLSEHGVNYVKYLPEEKYKGLHNSFIFVKDKQLGYINVGLALLEYKNYALTPVE